MVSNLVDFSIEGRCHSICPDGRHRVSANIHAPQRRCIRCWPPITIFQVVDVKLLKLYPCRSGADSRHRCATGKRPPANNHKQARSFQIALAEQSAISGPAPRLLRPRPLERRSGNNSALVTSTTSFKLRRQPHRKQTAPLPPLRQLLSKQPNLPNNCVIPPL